MRKPNSRPAGQVQRRGQHQVPAHDLQLLVEQFLHRLQVRNYASSTIKLRREYLGRFLRWCDERGITRIDEITRDVLLSYQRYLFHYRARRTGQPLKFSTQISLLIPIRAWFRYPGSGKRTSSIPYSAPRGIRKF